MAVDSVKCATLSSETTSSSTNIPNRATCSVFACGVMTNVCSPGLAHGAQSQSPTRPESPSSDAEAGSSPAAISSPIPAATITNSSAMQQLNETDINSSPSARLASDSAAAKPTSSPSSTDQSAMSPNRSPVNGDRQPDDEHRPEPMDTKADDATGDEPVNRPSSRDSRTSHTAVSPAVSPNHNEASEQSPPADKENDDRKELEEMLTEKNSKIKQLEDQLAKQRDYEQIKNELNLLKEQISLLRNEKPLDLLMALDKSRSMESAAALQNSAGSNGRSNNSSPPKPLLPNIQNMNMFASLLGEEMVRDSFLRAPRPTIQERPAATATEGNLLFGVDSVSGLLDAAAPQRISPALRRPQSADNNLKANMNSSNSNQSMTSSLANLPPEAFAALDNDIMMAKNNPSISQLTTSISSSLLASTNSNQYNPSTTPNPASTSSSSSLQIPQLDPMLTVTTPAAQLSLTKLTEKLRHNVDRYMNQNLNTQNISRCVRELLSVHNIGQRLFAKYVLGLSQGTVSELLSKPKQWDKLTEKGRDSYRKMHAWASDEDCIYWLKFLVPKKGKEVYNTSMISATMTNTASMITGSINNGSSNSNTSAIQNLAGALANGNSSNAYNPIAAALNKDDSGDRLQALFKAQSLFNQSNNGLNQSNNSSSNNPMLELMASAGNPQQQLMDLLLKSQSSNNQNGIQQQNLEGDCSQMSDDVDTKDRSMTPLDSFYKKLTNGGNQNDSMQEAMARLYQEQVTKMIAAQMEENMRQQQQQQQQSNNSNNNSQNEKPDDTLRQAIAIYQQEIAKLSSGGPPSLESLTRLQNAANVMNQASASQERLLLREGNLSRDSNSSANDESKGHNAHSSLNHHLNHSNNSNQQSNSAFPMVKNFLNSSNNGSGSSNMMKHEDSNSSGKSTPVNNSLNNGSSSGQPEDLSLVNSPLQRIQSITNSLLQHPHSSTSPNRSFIPNNNATTAQSKQILPPITQHQFDIYNNLNTEEIVKRVKEQLSQYSISQRLFGESVLGLSQGSVSDLLARPKPWHMLTQKGREPFIRMRMFLEDENAVHKLVASQYKIAPDKLMRTGNYAAGTNGSQIPSALSSDLSQLSNLTGLAALGGNLPGSALNALTAMDNGSIAAAAALNENASNNPAFAAALLLANNGNRLGLEAFKLLERHQQGSPINISNNSQNFHLNNSLMDSSNTQRSSANSTPERRSPSLNNSASSPNSQANLFLNNKRPTSTGPLSLNGLSSSEFSSQSLSSKMGYNQPQSVYEMAALTDTLDTQDVTTKIKESLMQHNIGQKIFGEVVLGLSQGSVSELLSKPKPWSMLSIKGREPFIRMKMWLNDPNNVEKLQSLKNERREANKRRRNADTDSNAGFPMEKLMAGGLENGSNDLYGPNPLNSFSPSNTSNLNNLLLANFNSGSLNNSNQFNMTGSLGPQSKKPRILFSDEQKEALKIAFQMDSYPTTSTIEQLSNELQLSVRTITNWFHNHRMRLKQVNSSNNASSPDENSSNYSFSSNGRENSNSTFDLQKFRTLLDQRINELKLNPANTTQSTIKMPKENRLSQAFNLCNPQLMELIRNGGDLSSISSLMNSLANNACVSPSSSNQEEYSYQEDDLDDEEAGEHNDTNAFQPSGDLSMANGNLRQQLSRQNNLAQRLQRRNNSEDECNYSENDDEEMQTGDLDENSDEFDQGSVVPDKRSKLMPRSDNHNTSASKKRKSAQPQYVSPKDNSLAENDKNSVEKKLAEQDEESSMHSIEAQ